MSQLDLIRTNKSSKIDRWTPEEDSVVINCIKNNPSNLTEAFEAASRRLNRTKPAVCYRWYKSIKPNSSNNVVSAKSETKGIKNTKNRARTHTNGVLTAINILWDQMSLEDKVRFFANKIDA